MKANLAVELRCTFELEQAFGKLVHDMVKQLAYGFIYERQCARLCGLHFSCLRFQAIISSNIVAEMWHKFHVIGML